MRNGGGGVNRLMQRRGLILSKQLQLIVKMAEYSVTMETQGSAMRRITYSNKD